MYMTKAQHKTFDALKRILKEHGIVDVYEDGIDHTVDGNAYPYINFIDQYIDDKEWRFLILPDGSAECFCSIPENRLSPRAFEGDSAVFNQLINQITSDW